MTTNNIIKATNLYNYINNTFNRVRKETLVSTLRVNNIPCEIHRGYVLVEGQRFNTVA